MKVVHLDFNHFYLNNILITDRHLDYRKLIDTNLFLKN